MVRLFCAHCTHHKLYLVDHSGVDTCSELQRNNSAHCITIGFGTWDLQQEQQHFRELYLHMYVFVAYCTFQQVFATSGDMTNVK